MYAQYMTVENVAEALGISKSKAYQIIRALNKELQKMGYITVAGKCPTKYFSEKYYGFENK